MDAVAKLALDLMLSDERLPEVINVVHPRPITWKMTIQCIQTALDSHLPLISLEDWVSRLAEQAVNATPKTLEEIVCHPTTLGALH